MTLDITPWDVVDHLDSEAAIEAYLEAALDDGDPKLVFAALGDIVRARGGMAAVSEATGLSRESLYRSLSKDGNPRFETVARIMDALGFQLEVKPKRLQKPDAA